MSNNLTYEQALDYLDGLLKFGIKFGLERITALSEALGNPHRDLRVIHVGGTNGKGSTATFIQTILSEAGYRTALYTSPYVRDLRERIQIDGRMIGREEFAEIISEIKPAADKIGQTDLGPVTEFEVKTMAAYLYFARMHVDFAVMEVGMGGRFDATNIVEPYVAVITNVSLDHTERLGDTVDKIAFEKAGIIKTGCTLVTAVDDEEAWQVILKQARHEGAEVWRIISSHARKATSPSPDVQFKYTTKENGFSMRGPEIQLIGLKPGLVGQFQHANAATAIAAVLALEKYEVRVPVPAIRAGIAYAYIPGRVETLQDNPKVIVDGAHNPAAARSLARAIRENYSYDRLILVIGMLSTHPCEGVLARLAPIASTVIATQSGWSKALPADVLEKEARKHCENVENVSNVSDAVKRALDIANTNDLVLVTGSFYTIGEVNILPE
ncbi:MAG: folylpolyglutamate synthase/dihydrofolate synthase family protein [Armatimonadota bacterium]|nr:bifunctional folylpolyglutamate synthase/dihydrofolate synthase [bacterium]